MAQAVILMIASRGCWIFGSGTVSTRTSPFPCQHSARMVVFSKMPAPTGEIVKRSNGKAEPSGRRGKSGAGDELVVPQKRQLR